MTHDFDAKKQLDECEGTAVTVWTTPQPSRTVELNWSGQRQFASLRSAMAWIKDEGEPTTYYDIHVHRIEGTWIPTSDERRALFEHLDKEADS